MAGKVRWHVTMSLDGFIAGPDDAMDWIAAPTQTEPGEPPPTPPKNLTQDTAMAAHDRAAVISDSSSAVLSSPRSVWPVSINHARTESSP